LLSCSELLSSVGDGVVVSSFFGVFSSEDLPETTEGGGVVDVKFLVSVLDEDSGEEISGSGADHLRRLGLDGPRLSSLALPGLETSSGFRKLTEGGPILMLLLASGDWLEFKAVVCFSDVLEEGTTCEMVEVAVVVEVVVVFQELVKDFPNPEVEVVAAPGAVGIIEITVVDGFTEDLFVDDCWDKW